MLCTYEVLFCHPTPSLWSVLQTHNLEDIGVACYSKVIWSVIFLFLCDLQRFVGQFSEIPRSVKVFWVNMNENRLFIMAKFHVVDWELMQARVLFQTLQILLFICQILHYFESGHCSIEWFISTGTYEKYEAFLQINEDTTRTNDY